MVKLNYGIYETGEWVQVRAQAHGAMLVRQRVSFSIAGARTAGQSEIESGEEEGPSGLPWVQPLASTKALLSSYGL